MKKENINERNIPLKNYVIVFSVVIFTLLLVLSLFIFFNVKKNRELQIPVIRGAVPEIEEKDVDSYMREHDYFLLYIGTSDNTNCRSLEEDLKDFIKTKNINNLVYLNITNVKDKKLFYDEYNKKYAEGVKLSNYPAFIIIRDNKIYDLVERDKRQLQIGDIQRLLDEYNILGD